jgi:COP9 signalosome complex subunit 12
MPAPELLNRFPILAELFSPFISAIRVGDLQSFDQALVHWERQLFDLNLYFTVEKAREICMRGLFRRA